MTQSGYTNAIVNAMLGWLKGLASWVLKLFNLSGGFSPLKFLANNWKHLLIIFLIAGVALDILVWLLRWRPHWIWFRKKRVIINDNNFFSAKPEENHRKNRDARPETARRPKENWQDNDFVIYGKDRRKKMEQAKKNTRRENRPQGEHRDVFSDDLFNVKAKQRFSDRYEDDVFNVANLPKKTQTQQKRPYRDINNENEPRRSAGKNKQRRMR